MITKFTILGSKGFVGSHLARFLKINKEFEVYNDDSMPSDDLGHVIYCIGVTTDFKNRLHDTMRAHVCKLIEILSGQKFESLTYLSSTRVYERGDSATEDSIIKSNPSDINDYYKISKLAGEAVCLSVQNDKVRVVRLSNIIGLELPALTFVPSLIRDGYEKKVMRLRSSLESAKDYILMEDVIGMLPKIACEGRSRLYNLGSGRQITHLSIVDNICSSIGCGYEVENDAQRSVFPNIDISRIKSEFKFNPLPILDGISVLCGQYINYYTKN